MTEQYANSPGGFETFPILVFFLLMIFASAGMYLAGITDFLPYIGAFIFSIVISSTVNINKEWEKSVILRLGRFHRITNSGFFFRIPVLEQIIRRDLRILTLDVEKQNVITRDNISVNVDAVVFMKVMDAKKSVIEIENFVFAVLQYAQTTMRNIVGNENLDDLLQNRKEIAEKIRKIVDAASDHWGIDIETLELQNIELPDDMKRVMARQAEAEREKRAVIIKSEGELQAANNLAEASKKLERQKYALELRKLETITDVGSDSSNTILFTMPLDTANPVSYAALAESVKQKKKGTIKIPKM